MGKSSNRGYYEPITTLAFVDGDPVSARRTWLLRNNIAHLVDQSTQHRINWVGDINGNGVRHNYAGTNGTMWYAQPFVFTSVNPDKPVNLDILIRGHTSDASYAAAFKPRVVPNASAIGDTSVEPYWEIATVTTTATSPSIMVDTQAFITVTSFPGFPNLREKWSETENGEVHYPLVHVARLDIAMIPTGDANWYLDSVMLREFV